MTSLPHVAMMCLIIGLYCTWQAANQSISHFPMTSLPHVAMMCLIIGLYCTWQAASSLPYDIPATCSSLIIGLYTWQAYLWHPCHMWMMCIIIGLYCTWQAAYQSISHFPMTSLPHVAMVCQLIKAYLTSLCTPATCSNDVPNNWSVLYMAGS